MFVRKVQEDEAGMRLDRWLKLHFPHFPQAWFERALRKGLIRVQNYKKCAASFRLEDNATLMLPDVLLKPVEGKGSVRKREEKKPLTVADVRFVRSLVLHKDKDIIVVNKPAGLATQGGHQERYHLDGLLDGLIEEGDKNRERPRLVHRLDKETSGLLVLARTRRAAQRLGQALLNRQVHKVYWALTEGVPERLEGLIDVALVKEGGVKTPYAYVKIDPTGENERSRSAQTRYRVLHTASVGDRAVAVMALIPLTGRTHQIRVHLAKVLHVPIWGDTRYGFRFDRAEREGWFGREHLHLHARQLTFPHPSTGADFSIEAPVPEIMEQAFREIGFSIAR